MADPQPAHDPPPRMECALCRQLIPRGARYCTHCGHYQQRWRRWLAGLNIQALVALIPIATLAFVFIREQLVTPRAELQLAALDCAGDQLELAVANLGERDAVFAGAALLPAEGAPIALRFAPAEQPELLVPAGQTRIYRMNALDELGGSRGLGLSRSAPCRFQLKAHAVAFEHSAVAEHAICACPAN